MAKVKRGLGKGLGALFGEDVVREAAIEQEEAREQREKREQNEQKEQKEQRGQKEQSDRGGQSGEGYNAGTAEDSSQKQGSTGIAEKTEEPRELTLKLSKIEPNREQPRKDFNEEQMQELADSIRQYGVLQPLLVQKKDHYYEIIAGERRWRAAKMAGLREVPVVIREYSKQQAVEIALIENVQREDLNPIEEALAYQRLMQEFQLKQEEIAERVSKNRTTITNSLRLLNLCEEVQQMLIEGRISNGHARALLGVEDSQLQLQLAMRIEKEHLSVREIEKLVKLLGKEPRKKKEKPEDEALDLIFHDLEDRMKTVMGTKVNISRKDKNKGRIEIEYYSESELERIVELIESIR